MKIVEFDDQEEIGKEGEIFGGEKREELQFQKQPWLWQGPHLVNQVQKTWFDDEETKERKEPVMTQKGVCVTSQSERICFAGNGGMFLPLTWGQV